MDRLYAIGKGIKLRGCMAVFFAAALLLLLLTAGGAAAEERHTAVFRCSGGGWTGVDDRGLIRRTEIEPGGTALASDGREWTLEELRQLDGFRLEGAALRFTVTSMGDPDLRYALECGESRSTAQTVRDGRNLWDVTAEVRAWTEAPEAELRFTPVFVQRSSGMSMAGDSASLQVTFSTAEKIADFPQDRVQYNALYEESLCMLEEGNPFVEFYDDTADSLMTVKLPLGVPYYYAGGTEEKFLRRFYPSTTTNYYQDTHMYLCGLDCVGMTRMVYEKCGLERHPSISDTLYRGVGHAALTENDPSRWPMLLQPGDLFNVKHGTFHVMMYLGTMRQFGMTEADAGEAAELLDYPLVIHCGGNPFYYERYEKYIADMNYRNTLPPDGGVTVSVVMATDRDAPHSTDTFWGKHFGWYELGDGQPLLVFRLDDCTDMAWYGPEEHAAKSGE